MSPIDNNTKRRAQAVILACAAGVLAFVVLVVFTASVGHKGCERDYHTTQALRTILIRSRDVTTPQLYRDGTLTLKQLENATRETNRSLRNLKLPSC